MFKFESLRDGVDCVNGAAAEMFETNKPAFLKEAKKCATESTKHLFNTDQNSSYEMHFTNQKNPSHKKILEITRNLAENKDLSLEEKAEQLQKWISKGGEGGL